MTNLEITADEVSAYTADPNVAAHSPNWWGRLLRAVANGWRDAARERLIRRQIEELRYLDDRILADMGMTRGSIASTVRQGYVDRAE